MAIEIYDFDNYEEDYSGVYGGRASTKYAIHRDGQRWMLKFPSSLKRLKGNHPSYATNPLCEYIGSHVYASLGIPVHETLLGIRDGRVVCACKDFAVERRLVEVSMLKNRLHEEEAGLQSSSSNEGGEYLSDVLAVIDHSLTLQNTPGVKERFWDMFVVDALIRNGDRNNGNWGVLISEDGKSGVLAPVYDNGSCLFGKRTLATFENRLHDSELMREDAFGTGVSFYLDEAGNHIHPFAFMRESNDPHLKEAVRRIAYALDLEAIDNMLDSIPEEAFGMTFLTAIERDYYHELFHIVIEEMFLPFAKSLILSTSSEFADFHH